ncbi:MAG: hypothetical protein WC211_11160 [Dehalococcoidia bacterium]
MADDWRESTEGDLDHDLTEEAGYAGWDPPPRRGWGWLYRLGLIVTLAVVAGSALLVLLR